MLEFRRHETSYQIEAALLTKVDVDEHNFGVQLGGEAKRVDTCRRNPDDGHSLGVLQTPGRIEEVSVVVDDRQVEGHGLKKSGSRSAPRH
jgi:hypothetical protein